jgi:hypothetical protein
MSTKRGKERGGGGRTLKNLPEAWRRWKLFQASDGGAGGASVVVIVGKGHRW